jgi:hypothetical protein
MNNYNLKTYLVTRAQLQPGQERFPSFAAHQAAEARIMAFQVEAGEPVMATNKKPIPVGDYAIVEIDEDGMTIMASQKAFFESTYELDPTRN